ncbi:PLP-dependent transferase [Coccomyxa subellipsoidea C-169]|uniref:PLP-dependent transferase n=1 Tax=Coccomyxa subellipsoidea (strain C-169) TaxID=574566 RepID=I0Z535_COCSC|nr:PLP-dependent transferase [Coccomyxa subellipsoidea C-169]EIE25754.1 PLP-dependent transferase [Coccomyxa subellipsoidea C-169]|eukprot:XP_005650298.1 PLP-dependent transferase [Coccomyxa subellipsoidea C-169]
MFTLDPSWHYLNHGSYGATIRFAAEVQQWWRERCEQQPVLFHETEVLPALKAARDEVAALIGAKGQDMVPVVNATAAANIVINGLGLRRGDLLLMTNLTYPAVKNALARAAAKSGAGLVEVQLPLSRLAGGPAEVAAAFDEALTAGRGRVKLAVIDHIGSFPPYTFPVQRLCSLCKAAGTKVLLDGAHAVGAQSLDVPSLGAHFYISNLHKWLCTPKGSAFLWVAPSEQPRTLPLITSHGYGLGFQGEFLWQGTSDVSAWLAVPAALRVMRAVGLDTWRDHNTSLLHDAVSLLSRAFDTDHVAERGSQFRMLRISCTANEAGASMAAVELPSSLPLAASVADALFLHEMLRTRFKIEVPVACWEGRLWVRISAQYYNTLEDYQALADAVRELISEGASAEEEEEGATNSFRRSLANGSAQSSNGASEH